MKRARALLFALLFALSVARAAAGSDEHANFARQLRSIARQIAVAAHSKAVPDVHVRPAPLSGRPRLSPSVDAWLQGALGAARHDAGRRRAADLREIAGSLRYLAGQIESPPAPQPRADVPATIRSILADPSYSTTEVRQKAPAKSWWQRFLDWLGKEFEKIFGGVFSAASASPLFGKVVAVLLLAATALAVAVLCYRLVLAYLAGRPRRKSETIDEAIDPAPDPAALHAAALQAAREAQYARAVALLFQASLVAFDRAGAIDFDPARTAGEYRRAVRRIRAAASQAFDRLAHAFTYAAYAERPTGEGEWREAEGAYRTLEPLVHG